MTAQDSIPVISSVAGLAGRYDAWLCDIWGVIHNGVTPFDDAVEACIRFRDGGGVIVALTNSPRPCHAVAAQLEQIGVPATVCDAIVTSGDTTRRTLADRRGQSLFHLGPERDKPLLEGLDLDVTGLDQADYVLCSGLYDDLSETPGDYRDLLALMKARDLEMVCANPDVQVERGDRLIYCAGALAAAYEKLGGKTLYAGKPHPPIYDMSIARIAQIRGEEPPRSRILCIGDGIKTDMAGAANGGMDALYVASALHMENTESRGSLDAARLKQVFSGASAMPVAAQERLKW